MKSKKLKRLLSAGLSIAMLATMSLSASAITYDVPTSPMTVDENLILCAAHAQADATPEIIGLTNTTDRAGEVPADYSLQKAQSSVLIGTFGTDINSSPNPYLYNWAYNSWATENGKTLADKHTLGGISGHPNSVDSTIVDELGTSRSLYYRPDILVGTAIMGQGSSYQDLIAALPENTDADKANDYNPYIVTYLMTTCTDFLTTLYEIANDCEEIMKADSSKKMRYGDPIKIADQLTKYTVGIQSYILKKLSENNAEKKTVAIFDPINSADGNFFCVDAGTSTQGTTTRSRVGEFLDQTTENVVHKLGKQATSTMINNAEKFYYNLTAEEIVENADVIVTGGVNNGGNKSEAEIREMLSQYIGSSRTDLLTKLEKMPVMSSSFSTVGSIGANSIENLLGMAYWPSYCYPEYINPVYAATYWYYNFYHVTDNSKLETIISSTMDTASKPDGIEATTKGYSESAFQSLINEGMAYYKANKATINNEILDGMAALLTEKEVPSIDVINGETTTTVIGDDIAALPGQETTKKYSSKNGEIEVTAKFIALKDVLEKAGVDVSKLDDPITLTAADGFTVEVTAEELSGVFLYQQEDGTWRSAVDGSAGKMWASNITSVTVISKAAVDISNFKDVSAGDWFYDAVANAVAKGLFNGMSETTFEPNTNMNRAMFVTVLSRMEGIDASQYSGTSFSDVDAGQWYSAAIQWASQKEIVGGVGDGKFDPNGNVTREQMATILYRYLKSKNVDTSNVSDSKFNAFSDASSVHDWAVEAVKWATDKGVINGMGDGTINPGGDSTRAQVAQVFLNYQNIQ